ncbi:MAG: thiamine-phosphate kinase [Bacteroidota bacterium]
MESFENSATTSISALGEFGLIDHLTKNITIHNKSTKLGVGDDCAIVAYPKNEILISTDIMVEDVHFDLTYTPLKHLGYKAAMTNFSDICAMNGIPKQITIGIALSSKYSLEAVEEIYAGIILACNKHKVDIVGGDTTSSKKGLFLSITVIGEAKKNTVAFRNGAKENNLICVTGDLGAAFMGLQILEREKQVFLAAPGTQPDLEGKDYILERFLKPEARLDIIASFEKIGLVPTSMIDISDGLASELLHICKSSEKGCTIYEEKIPIDQLTYETAREFNLDPTVCALNGGEDYELLFTIDQKDYEKIKTDPNITVIGFISENKDACNLISKSETIHPLTAQGWNHMRNNDNEQNASLN